MKSIYRWTKLPNLDYYIAITVPDQHGFIGEIFYDKEKGYIWNHWLHNPNTGALCGHAGGIEKDFDTAIKVVDTSLAGCGWEKANPKLNCME